MQTTELRSFRENYENFMSNYTHCKVWDEITYPLQNFNGCIVKVCGGISNFTPHYTGHVITNPCWD